MNKVKILHVSDTHIRAGSRFEECAMLFDRVVELAVSEKVDLVAYSGDVYDKASVPIERELACDFLQRLAAQAPVVGVRGNHDPLRDVEIFNRLESKHSIVFAEVPRTVQLATGLVDVICLPWFDKTELVAQLGPECPAADTDQRTIQLANGLLHLMRVAAENARKNGRIPIGLGHLLVSGSEVSSGQTLQGVTVELSAGDLLHVGCAYFALGHIHKAGEKNAWGLAATMNRNTARLSYAGSHMRHDYGEIEPKGVRLIEIEESGSRSSIRNELVLLPARQILHIEADLTDPDKLRNLREFAIVQMLSYHDEIPGALVRVRYRHREEDKHLIDEDIFRRLLSEAHQVKIEGDPVPATRIRSQEIINAVSTQEKVQAFWSSKGIVVDEPTRDLAWQCLAQIETEQRLERAASKRE